MDASSDAYDAISEYYDLLYLNRDSKGIAAFLDTVFSSRHAVRSVLDMGAGTGNLSFELAKKGYDMTCVDPSEKMLEQANQKIPSAEILQGTLQGFSSENQFDAAISIFSVINSNTTFDELVDSFKNMHRHLNKGGVYIFDSGLPKSCLKSSISRYHFNTDAGGSIYAHLRSLPSQTRIITFNMLVLKKFKGHSLDMDVHNLAMGLFSLREIKKALRKAGFSYTVYNGYSGKKYSAFARFKYDFPVFVAVKK